MNAQEITGFIASLGGGGVLLALITGLIKWLSGASHRERLKNTSIVTQRTKAIEERQTAEKERDAADDKRRNAEEYISVLKRQLQENGLEPHKRPPVEEEEE